MPQHAPVEYTRMNANELLAHSLLVKGRGIIFRGEARTGYKLVPSALRGATDTVESGYDRLHRLALGYLNDNGSMNYNTSDLDQQDVERMALTWFHDLANMHGLDVPRIPRSYLGDPFKEVMATKKSENSIWMRPESWIEIAALAQHYGIPTRLLDWSFDFDTALFFASRDLTDEQLPSDGCAAIWELDRAKLSHLTNDFRFIVPDYRGNPNIMAQKGLFSLYFGDGFDEHTPMDAMVSRICKQDDKKRMAEVYSESGPLLCRIGVPYAKIRRLASVMLNSSRYDMFFPGLSDIAASMLHASERLSVDRRRSE